VVGNIVAGSVVGNIVEGAVVGSLVYSLNLESNDFPFIGIYRTIKVTTIINTAYEHQIIIFLSFVIFTCTETTTRIIKIITYGTTSPIVAL
jgi:hypothetical protein